MQVAQAEALGAIDDDSVGIGDIQSALHDSGREEHIVIVVGKVEHHLLQGIARHSSVSHSHPCIGHAAVQHGLEVGQLADTRSDEEHLSAATHLEANGLGDGFRAEGTHLGLYWAAVGRRCLYDAQVPGTHQAKLQRAGDGRGGEGEGIHIGLHLTQFLLGAHAELLLLVDD